MKTLFLLICLFMMGSLSKADVIKIEIGKEKGSSSSDLERRVWYLERAVRQLQDRIYDLESDKGNPVKGMFTCQISSFGKSFSATEPTEMAAKAKVLKQCADASNAIHCEKKDVECGN